MHYSHNSGMLCTSQASKNLNGLVNFLYCMQVLRMEPHCVISNRTGVPLQLMHYSPGSSVQQLGNKATGVQPSRGQQPQRVPSGLRGVVAQPDQDWTSCTDVPAGARHDQVHVSCEAC